MDSELIIDIVFAGIFVLVVAGGGIYSIKGISKPQRSDSIFSLNGLKRNSSSDSFDKLSQERDYEPDYPLARWAGKSAKRLRKRKRKRKSIKSKRG